MTRQESARAPDALARRGELAPCDLATIAEDNDARVDGAATGVVLNHHREVSFRRPLGGPDDMLDGGDALSAVAVVIGAGLLVVEVPVAARAAVRVGRATIFGEEEIEVDVGLPLEANLEGAARRLGLRLGLGLRHRAGAEGLARGVSLTGAIALLEGVEVAAVAGLDHVVGRAVLAATARGAQGSRTTPADLLAVRAAARFDARLVVAAALLELDAAIGADTGHGVHIARTAQRGVLATLRLGVGTRCRHRAPADGDPTFKDHALGGLISHRHHTAVAPTGAPGVHDLEGAIGVVVTDGEDGVVAVVHATAGSTVWREREVEVRATATHRLHLSGSADRDDDGASCRDLRADGVDVSIVDDLLVDRRGEVWREEEATRLRDATRARFLDAVAEPTAREQARARLIGHRR